MRPKNADPAATQEAILSAAMTIVSESGPTTLSLRGVARKAGLSTGTVSYYFSSLDALCEACLDGHYDRMRVLALKHFQRLADSTPAEVTAEATRELYRFGMVERPILLLQLSRLAEHGGHTVQRRVNHHRNMMRNVAASVGTDTWLKIQSLVFAATRYLCLSEEDLLLFTGANTLAEAHDRIEQHLVDMALLTVGQAATKP
ncbi:MAG: TetR/AcrR family transcriptional regulator [Polyangiaceae bacterium]|nr:TetR/AcrR family transcriptional regulator [Myxococcales bacterium]MCB9587879.1 TetR/AcrR family transcriptional regulator [Polyangiaceae bacterium]